MATKREDGQVMTSQIQRGHRISIALDTAFALDDIHVRGAAYEDALGRPYEMTVDIDSPDSINPESLLGAPATVIISPPTGPDRRIDGFVFGVEESEYGARQTFGYSLTVMPWIWLLTLRSDSRIFTDMTVVQVIESVLSDVPQVEFDIQGLTATYPVMEYCVQYQETDFQFVSRLLEREGIFYYFQETPAPDGSHRQSVVFADENALPSVGSARYLTDPRRAPTEPCVWSVRTGHHVGVTRMTLQGFDFKAPNVTLSGDEITSPSGYADGDNFSYSSDYTSGTIARYAKIDLESHQALRHRTRAAANEISWSAGGVINVAGHPRSGANGEQIVVGSRFRLRGESPEAESGEYETPRWRHRNSTFGDSGESEDRRSGPPQGDRAEADFRMQITTIPHTVPFRTERLTPVPRIAGPQTATVGGVADSLGAPDEHGRIKIHFHWDRYPGTNNLSTAFVRLSQQWAGAEYGSFHLPHPGHEVVVEFLEGNPDRPLITGSVYNELNKLPRSPIHDARISIHETVVARDHFGNQIVLDSTPGEENIRLHSPKNNSTFVVGKGPGDGVSSESESDWISIEVGNSNDLTIGSSSEITLGASHSLTAGVGAEENIGASVGLSLASSLELTVGQSAEMTIGPSLSWAAGPSFEARGSDDIKTIDGDEATIAGGPNVVASATESRLVASTMAGSGAGLLQVFPDKIEIGVGTALDGLPMKGNSAVWLALGANVLGFLAGALAGVTAVIAGAKAVKDRSGESVYTAIDPPLGAVIATGVAAVLAGTACGAVSAAAILAAKRVPAGKLTPYSPATPSSSILLEKNTLDIGSEKVNIFTKQQVMVMIDGNMQQVQLG